MIHSTVRIVPFDLANCMRMKGAVRTVAYSYEKIVKSNVLHAELCYNNPVNYPAACCGV